MNNSRQRTWRLLATAGLIIVSLILLSPVAALVNGQTTAYLPLIRNDVPPTPMPVGWRAEYYTNANLTGTPAVVQYEDYAYPAKDWGWAAPAPGIPADYFSARFTKTVWFDAGTYDFYLTVDDGGRVYIDNQLVIDAWHPSQRGIASYRWNGTLTAGNHEIRVEYFDHQAGAHLRLFWMNVGQFPQWRAEYWNNPDMAGNPVLVRNEPGVNMDWGDGSPGAGIPADHFSARFTRAFYLDGDGMYVFYAEADDNVRVSIDYWSHNQSAAIDAWTTEPGSMRTSAEILPPGWYVITVHYREFTGSAKVLYQHVFGGTTYGFRGHYFANQNLSGAPALIRDDDQHPSRIQLDWGTGSPAPNVIPEDHFSVRWSHVIQEPAAGNYRIMATYDDGVRVYLDGRLIIDDWSEGATRSRWADVTLGYDWHTIQVEYFEATGAANVTVHWYRQ